MAFSFGGEATCDYRRGVERIIAEKESIRGKKQSQNLSNWAMKRIISMFRQSNHAAALPQVPGMPSDDDVPKYPPFVRGIPAASVPRILEDQKDLLTRIRIASPASDTLWGEFYIPLIENYASYVHLLPASERHHHRLAGGLLRHGLESALWGIQFADRHMFAMDVSAQQRKDIEPRWQFAAFVSALCHDIGKPASDMIVNSVTDMETAWNPFDKGLLEWLRESGTERYVVNWRKDSRHKRHERISPIVLDRVLDPKGRAYIAGAGPEIFKQIMLALEGEGFGQLQEIVSQADSASVEKDLKQMPAQSEEGGGIPVSKVLLGAMRHLAKHDWAQNVPGGQVWRLESGLYILWPSSAAQLKEQLKRDGASGIPTNPEVVADILIEQGVAQANGQNRYWWIAPECLIVKHPDLKLSAIKLVHPESVLDNDIPAIPGDVVEVKKKPAIQDGASEPDDSHQPSMDAVQNSAEDAQVARAPSAADSPPNQSEAGGDAIDLSAYGVNEDDELDNEPDQGKPDEMVDASLATDEVGAIIGAQPSSLPKSIVRLGPVGEAMILIAEELRDGSKKWEGEAKVLKDGLAILYPNGVKGYGFDPKKILDTLVRHQFIEPDPFSPTRNVREVAGMGLGSSRAIVVGGELASVMLKIANKPGKEEMPVREEVVSKEAPPAKKPRKKKQEKSSTHQEQSKGEVNSPPENNAPGWIQKQLAEVTSVVGEDSLIEHDGRLWMPVSKMLEHSRSVNFSLPRLIGVAKKTTVNGTECVEVQGE